MVPRRLIAPGDVVVASEEPFGGRCTLTKIELQVLEADCMLQDDGSDRTVNDL